MGPDRFYGTLPSEASGREAVTLDSVGEYVEFTLTVPANAVTFRYSLPDSPTVGGTPPPTAPAPRPAVPSGRVAVLRGRAVRRPRITRVALLGGGPSRGDGACSAHAHRLR
ncbi:hypothetical protein [Micromonospora sp. CPCC 205547]|uniref:hypothetical protein n=1 Tax=Micromonospora sp. CPCC 205547 TaxID=3122400 RepID=UPI003B9699D8